MACNCGGSCECKGMHQRILDLIENYGSYETAEARQWILDRIVRIVTKTPEDYEKWKEKFRGYYNPDTQEYEFDEWSEGSLK